MTRPRRAVLLGAVLAALGPLLSGCGAGTLGVVGVTRTTDGTLAVTVARCASTVGKVRVGHGEADANGHRPDALVLEADEPSRQDLVTLPLDADVPGWRRTPADFAPVAGEVYTVTAVSGDNGYTTQDVRFDSGTSEVTGLVPGRVLVTEYADDGNGRTVEVQRVMPLEEFRRSARNACE